MRRGEVGAVEFVACFDWSNLIYSFYFGKLVYHIWEYDEIFGKISSILLVYNTKTYNVSGIVFDGKMESKPIDREAVLNSLVLNNSTTDGQPRKRKRLDNLSVEERALRR